MTVNDGKTTVHRNGQEEVEEILPKEKGDLPMNRAFVEAMLSGDQSGILCDYADAARTFAVTMACQKSAEQGQPIDLEVFMAT